MAIPLLASCQKDEPQKTQSWPEWFETATPFDKDFVDVLFFAPYYHQATFSAISDIVDIEKGVKAFGTSLADASKIFRYYKPARL